MDKVVHFEIPVDDLERATDFYETVFGWKIESVPDMDYNMVYTTEVDKKKMIKEKGAINGGMMMREKPIENVVITIHVKNINNTLKKIEQIGGKIVQEKMEVPEMGYTAYFKDREGNILGLWEDLK